MLLVRLAQLSSDRCRVGATVIISVICQEVLTSLYINHYICAVKSIQIEVLAQIKVYGEYQSFRLTSGPTLQEVILHFPLEQ